MARSNVGQIGWIDLTADNAENIREFYERVTGWKSAPVSLGTYNDHCMLPPDSETPVAGICHRKGNNAGIPRGWTIHITVADIDASIRECVELGGVVVDGPRQYGASARYCIIRDPEGAHVALYCETVATEEK